MVPPEPTPATKMSTVPSVSAQISGPVEVRWAAGLDGFVKLAGDEAARDLPGQLLRPGDGPRHAQPALGQHHLGPIGQQELTPLLAHGVRHDDDGPVTPGGGHQCQTDACVARGGLDDDQEPDFRMPRASPSSSMDLAMRSFGGPAGVEALQLPQDAGAQAQLPLKMRQLQQGRPPDQLLC